MKIPFVLVGAGVVLGLVYLVSLPGKAMPTNTGGQARTTTDDRPLPAPLKEVESNAAVGQTPRAPVADRQKDGRGDAQKTPPAVARDLTHRGRALLLFLQTLRTPK